MNSVAPSLRLSWSIVLLAALFVAAGIAHFVVPKPYIRIVPSFLPNAPLLVAVSGIAELLGGLGVLLPATRAAAGWGLIALLVAVFPANIQMLRLAIADHSSTMWQAVLWFRLPFQPAIVWWAWKSAVRS